jgi:aminoglycoside phosphotransferase (APT) family kinase protein
MPDLTSAAALCDPARLTAWLDGNIPDLGTGTLKAEIVHGGTSNVIISLNRGGKTMMLRRPPAVPPPGSDKGILREARVLAALNGTDVPHPHCYGVCTDAEVIGAPFYVMQRCDGWAAELRDGKIYDRAPFDVPPHAAEIPFAMVDGLIALAKVDYRAVGLEGFGKPDNFLERQVDRWEGQIKSYKQLYDYEWRELPGYARLRDWLRANIPSTFKAGIIHGDVGTPNALFTFDSPARLTALIDWELSTIGDPLLDLAWFLGGLCDERFPGHVPEKALYNITAWPTRQMLMAHYAAGTGRNLADFDYYLLLGMFKSACILEYKVAQAAKGILSEATGRFFDRLVRGSFIEAEKLINVIG